MATTKTNFSKPNNRFGSITNHTGSNSYSPPNSPDLPFEINESDFFGSDETRPDLTETHTKPVKTASQPVEIPDWSKILKNEYTGNKRPEMTDGDYDEDEDGDDLVPPHEIIARQVARSRTRVVSFSMHEGIGRTLKGRDLYRVRNAVFALFGFAD